MGQRQHAVVLGASMAGLGAARVLCEHFERVTLVERDALGDVPGKRKGVPQGEHAHGLLASGYRVLDEYFPGMMNDLVATGALRGDVSGDFLWFNFGRWKLRADSGLPGFCVSRPMLETAVRRRVRALPKITLLSEHDVEAPVYDAGASRVTGVVVKNRGTGESTTLEADLVIDALGRGSSSPQWLASWGFGEVTVELVKVDVGYASARFERRPGDVFGSNGAVITGTAPRETRHGFIIGAENNQWVVTLCGVLRDYPQTELARWREFARSLPTPVLFELVKDREPLTELTSYRFPANQRRWFSRLPRFPPAYLVLGDAVCSFNPAYGQGMSVALSEAKALEECLAEGDKRLAPRFFKRVDGLLDAPWAITTGEDLRHPTVEGKRPFGFGFVSRYMERAHHVAAYDPVVARRFFEVANLVASPTAMMAPGVAWRVLRKHDVPATDNPATKHGAATPRA